MKNPLSRRKFVKRGVGLAATGLGATAHLAASPAVVTPLDPADRLPREVWVGTVSMDGLNAADAKGQIAQVLHIMEHFIPYRPDIICLPECFAFANIATNFRVENVAEKVPGPVISPFIEFAKAHQCYIICPTYTREQGRNYIAAVLIDRQGQLLGEYRKARPTAGEIALGVSPGPIHPTVFETDFGKIGIQICFDLKWEAGWVALKNAGAEIIFWPSAYAGGRELCSRAWRQQVYIVSSTQKDTSRICDMSGEVMAQTGRWQRNWLCAPLNLEKTFLHAWPAVQKYPEIQKRYGRKIRLTTFAEEEWTILESLDPSVKIADILKEFDLQTHHELIAESGIAQQKNRD